MLQRPTLDRLDDSQRGVAASIGGRLAAAGHQAWIVGGVVRDLALGRPSGDLDIATDAHPDAVEALFTHTIGVGRAFGTVVVADFGAPIEVTTFRADGDYRDGRRPEQVVYSKTLEEDAARRDFTCNALYLGAISGELRDPTGGLADLAAGRLRTVGDARARFTEDSLRLLRLVRFAATHALVPEAATLEAARRTAPLLARIARERVLAELCDLCERGDVGVGFELLHDLGLVGPAFGPDVELDTAKLAAARHLGRAPGAATGLALVFAGGEREVVRERLQRLRPSRDLERSVLGLVEALARTCEPRTSVSALVRLREHAEPRAWLRLARAWARSGAAYGPSAADVERVAEVLAEWPAERALPTGALAADDLVALGVPRGPRLGVLLRAIVDARVEGRVHTRADEESLVRAALATPN
jgi:tRNA nucleotidyltransferase (CCA-adding enzyme)